MKRFDTLLYTFSLTAGVAMIGLNVLSAYETVEYKPAQVAFADQEPGHDAVKLAASNDVVPPTEVAEVAVEQVDKAPTPVVPSVSKPARRDKTIPIDPSAMPGGGFAVVGADDSWTKK